MMPTNSSNSYGHSYQVWKVQRNKATFQIGKVWIPEFAVVKLQIFGLVAKDSQKKKLLQKKVFY